MNNENVTINNLPYNDFYFLVIKYAAVTKFDSKSKIPNIQVILRKVNLEKEEFLPNEADTIIYLPMNELDIVKIGSVWKKQKLIKKTWSNYNGLKYEENLDFKFDFSYDKFEIVTYSEYINELGASLSDMYKVFIQNCEKKRIKLINKTKYTKFMDNTNKINLLVPSMELFIATYAPDHKTIRQRFLQYDIDTAIDEFIIKDESYVDDDKYYVRVRKKMDDNNVKFLAYMLFNHISRKRAKKLWMSLEYDEGDYDGSTSPVRYPEVLPFHPSYLNIHVDGIWLNKNVFLVLRINNRNLPTDNEVIPISKKITVDIVEVDYNTYQNEPDKKHFDEDTNSDKADDNETDSDSKNDDGELLNNLSNEEFTLDSNNTPHTRESTHRILTEVGVIGESNPLKYINIEKNYNVEKPVYENKFSDNEVKTENSRNIIQQEPNSSNSKEENNTQLSSQESDLSQENSGINKLILETKKTSEVTKKLFESVIQALKNLKSQSKIQDYKFIDKKFESQIEFALTSFHDTICFYKEQCSEIDNNDSWLKLNEIQEGKRSFLGYREYLLVEIDISEDIFYLLEIGKKSTEGYSGLVFKSNDMQRFPDSDLLVILKQIILKKGTYIKKSEDGFNPIDLGVNYNTYKHYFNKKTKKYLNLEEKINNKINELKREK